MMHWLLILPVAVCLLLWWVGANHAHSTALSWVGAAGLGVLGLAMLTDAALQISPVSGMQSLGIAELIIGALSLIGSLIASVSIFLKSRRSVASKAENV